MAKLDQIGTYVFPVEGVPRAFHMGIFYAYVGAGGDYVTTTFEAGPTISYKELGSIAAGWEAGRELVGIPNSNSPFGPIKFMEKEVVGPNIQLPEGATNVKVLTSGYDFDGDIVAKAMGIRNTFVEATQYAYEPAGGQNSNTVAVTALNNNGLYNPYTSSTSSSSQPLDQINVRDPSQIRDTPAASQPWLPGADGRLSVPFTGTDAPSWWDSIKGGADKLLDSIWPISRAKSEELPPWESSGSSQPVPYPETGNYWPVTGSLPEGPSYAPADERGTGSVDQWGQFDPVPYSSPDQLGTYGTNWSSIWGSPTDSSGASPSYDTYQGWTASGIAGVGSEFRYAASQRRLRE